MKIKFENKMIEQLIFCYFNVRNFEISNYRSFCISSFQILTPTHFVIFYFLKLFDHSNYVSFPILTLQIFYNFPNFVFFEFLKFILN